MFNTGNLLAQQGLDWTNAKFRGILVDMNDAGPVPGAWKITNFGTWSSGGAVANAEAVLLTTQYNHGLSVGNQVSIMDLRVNAPTRQNSTAYSIGDYMKPSGWDSMTAAGYKYRCVKAGTTASAAPTPYPLTLGHALIDGSVVWVNEGSSKDNGINSVHTVALVPQPNTLVIDIPVKKFTYDNSVDNPDEPFLANLNKLYLSEFVPLHGRISVSDPITSKQVLLGGVLDCQDIRFDIPSGNDKGHAIIIVKTANAHTAPDVGDIEQLIIAYFDTLTGLPVPANAATPLSWKISDGPNRLMRL